MSNAIQDHYPEDFSHCYGCGRLNFEGHQIKSRWDGDELVARFTPTTHQISVPGFVYGGLIASLIDCHAMGSAAAAAERAAGREIGEAPAPRFVTASMKVDFLKPTQHGPELEIRSTIRERSERKAVVDVEVRVEGEVTATGEVVAVRMPPTMAASTHTPRA